MSAREKIAYLRGLIEGQSLSGDTGLSKFHEALLGALDSIAGEIEDLKGYVEDIDDDLMDLHSEMEPGFSSLDDGRIREEDDEEEYESIRCPNCEKDFFYEPDAYDDDEDLLCPHCGEPFKQS